MEVIGIDVSKQTFDAWSKSKGHKAFKNSLSGYKQLLKWLDTGRFVMESTSTYHFQLALYLHEQGKFVSVVNPLPVKRFMQMRMQRLKTDKSDSKLLAAYGESEQPQEWVPDPEYMHEGKQLLGLIELYIRQQTALKNKLDNLRVQA